MMQQQIGRYGTTGAGCPPASRPHCRFMLLSFFSPFLMQSQGGGLKSTPSAAALAAVRVARPLTSQLGTPQAAALAASRGLHHAGVRKRKASEAWGIERGSTALAETSPLFGTGLEQERRLDLLLAHRRNELREMFASFRRGDGGGG